MILRLQELVQNLYVEVLFVRCTVFWRCSCFLRRSCPTSVCTTLRSIHGFSHTALLWWFQVSLSDFVWYLHFIVTRTSIQRITTYSLHLRFRNRWWSAWFAPRTRDPDKDFSYFKLSVLQVPFSWVSRSLPSTPDMILDSWVCISLRVWLLWSHGVSSFPFSDFKRRISTHFSVQYCSADTSSTIHGRSPRSTHTMITFPLRSIFTWILSISFCIFWRCCRVVSEWCWCCCNSLFLN